MVGVYYGDYLLTYKTSQTYQDPGGQTFVYNVEFGKANIALFDYITSGLFREVKHFSRLPFGSWTMGNIDLIIEPTVDHYSPWFPVDLEYKVKFYLPSGKIIIWPIKGTSQEQLTSFMDQIISTNNLIKHTQFAMRDFAAKFMVGFCKHYELKNFFSDQCGQ